MQTRKKWCIVYTQRGCEQKVADILTKKKFENFYPVNKVIHTGISKHKIIYQPLLDRYVFVYMSESDIGIVKDITGVISFIYWLDKLAVASDEEVYTLRQFLNTYEFVWIEKTRILRSEKAKVTYDTDINGTKEEKQVVKLCLPSIGYTIAAIDKTTNVRVINAAKKQVLPMRFFIGSNKEPSISQQ